MLSSLKVYKSWLINTNWGTFISARWSIENSQLVDRSVIEIDIRVSFAKFLPIQSLLLTGPVHKKSPKLVHNTEKKNVLLLSNESVSCEEVRENMKANSEWLSLLQQWRLSYACYCDTFVRDMHNNDEHWLYMWFAAGNNCTIKRHSHTKKE